ncbi:MAG: protein kinase [Acidobacteriia bacterium]|nr:protein kinase [Terriglobia bacterium]
MASWQRIKRLFEEVADLPPDQRIAYLDRVCAGDDVLHAEVLKLVEADQQATTSMNDPATQPLIYSLNVFSPGQVVANRFRIVCFLGAGGMGEVYQAEDQVLGGFVALKTIRNEIASDERTFERFKQEVRLAKEVTDDNVCRVFDLDHRNRPPFLTMEMLAGETLSHRLRQVGKMTAAEALPLAQQIAKGLGAAHQRGILHRDLKPSNIMLTPGEGGTTRVKVMDFGLARTESDHSQSSGKPVGTPSYMAPEQLEGGKTTVASDLYTLGLVLYEMVTGNKPAFQRLSEPAPSPRVHVPELDSNWEAAILRCLERDPGRRFKSAAEVAQAVQGDTRRRHFSRRVLLMGTGSLILLALFLVFLRVYYWSATVREGSSVLLTQVENLTQDPELDAVADVLRAQLGQSAHFNLVGGNRVAEILREMVRDPNQKMDAPTAREVALREGAPLVIFGALTRLSQGYTLNLQIEKVRRRPDVAAASWPKTFNAASKKELFGAIRDGSSWIRGMAGEAAGDLSERDQRPQDATTSSWPALRRLMQANIKNAAGDREEAVRLLREAIQLDPEFAMAHMRLADILITLERYSEGYEAWQSAMRYTKTRTLTRREELQITGQYYDDTGDFVAAEKAYRALAAYYPNDFLPLFFLGVVLAPMGHESEAIEKLSEAAKKRPGDFTAPAHLAQIYLDRGQFQEAEAEVNKVRAFGQPEWAAWLRGASRFLQHRYDEGLKRISELSESADEDWRSRGYALSASWLGELGKYREAEASLREGIKFDVLRRHKPAQCDKYLLLAYIAYRRQEFKECRNACRLALELDNSPNRLSRTGVLLARSGYVSEAQSFLNRMPVQPDIPVLRLNRYRLEGEIALAKRDTLNAVRLLKAAAQLEWPRADRHYLARAQARAGDVSGALETYKLLVDRPGLLWLKLDPEYPGLWADSLFQYASLAHRAGNKEAASLVGQYLDVRKNADDGLNEVEDASKLWP